MKRIFFATVALLVILTALGCQKPVQVTVETTDTATGSGEPIQSFSTVYELDRIFELPPMKVGLVNVGIVTNTIYKEGDNVQRGHLALGLEVANMSQEQVWFYPEQLQVVLNSGETLSADISISSDIGGSFPEKRVKKGFILFPIIETEPQQIDQFTLKIMAPLDENHQSLTEDQEIKITLQ